MSRFLGLALLFSRALGTSHFGSLDIDNEGIETYDENCLEITFANDCDDNTPATVRADLLLDRFPCIFIKEDTELISFDGSDESYLYLDVSDSSCISDDININDLCILHVSNDGLFEVDTHGDDRCCQSRSTSASDLPSGNAWGLDSLDGTFDNNFDYYYCPNHESLGKVDLYVVDTGIRASHEEFFNGQVQNLYSVSPHRNTAASDEWHGTHVASTAGGRNYGVSRNQRIYNVYVCRNVAASGRASCSTSHTMTGLFRIFLNLLFSGRRGVINISLGGFSLSTYNQFFNAFNAIQNLGGVVAVSAGNSNVDASTTLPAAAVNAITVGAHDISYRVASFSNYGSVVDIFAPGVSVRAASSETDTSYRLASGTSMASPHVAGIVTNWLLECERTNYHVPCTLANINARLSDYAKEVSPRFGNENGIQCGSTGVACEAIQYSCGQPFYPRPISQCNNSPCGFHEAGWCKIWHPQAGCDQCYRWSFKKSTNYPCTHCKIVMGNICDHCNDYFGCAQCINNNNFNLHKDDTSNLWYCKPTPCLNPDNNCLVCNNGECSQCMQGYTLNSDRQSCS